jgi:Tfp pilus assembly protein PilO
VKTRRPSRAVTVALIIAADVMVFGAGWFMLVVPQRHQAASTARSVNQTEALILQAEAAQAAAANPPAAPKQPVIRTADLYRLAKAMPTGEDMPDLLLELDQVARAAGVTVLSITPSTPAPGTGYEVVPVRLTFTGDFYALTDLMYRLRTLVSIRHGSLDAAGRLFAVGSLSLAPTGTGKNLSASVTVNAFTYGGGTTTGVAVTPTTTTGSTTTTTATSGG